MGAATATTAVIATATATTAGMTTAAGATTTTGAGIVRRRVITATATTTVMITARSITTARHRRVTTAIGSAGTRYYGRNVVVYDYGSYRLRPPPRGYHWVRENNDFLLVAIATGIIFDIATR